MSFWPDEINSNEVLSPRQIMDDAGEELKNATGTLTVSIQETRLEDRVVFAFWVAQRESKVTLNLFEASHQLDKPYPVVILPPEDDIPGFLKEKRYVSGSPDVFGLDSSTLAVIRQMSQGTPGRYVENEWVCATPTEFEEKLTELFSEDYVKVRIISLIASSKSEGGSGVETDDTSEDSTGAE